MPGWWCWQKPFCLRSSTMPGQWQVTVDSGVPSWDRSLLKEDSEVGKDKVLNENVFVMLLRQASGFNSWINAFFSCLGSGLGLKLYCVQGSVFLLLCFGFCVWHLTWSQLWSTVMLGHHRYQSRARMQKRFVLSVWARPPLNGRRRFTRLPSQRLVIKISYFSSISQILWFYTC